MCVVGGAQKRLAMRSFRRNNALQQGRVRRPKRREFEMAGRDDDTADEEEELDDEDAASLEALRRAARGNCCDRLMRCSVQ